MQIRTRLTIIGIAAPTLLGCVWIGSYASHADIQAWLKEAIVRTTLICGFVSVVSVFVAALAD
mgnify:CR=1 FL=1